jgi:hydroxymethylpyrimidine/phosphomethylpyrimidine kinase
MMQGCYGLSVITALTAQNTTAVTGIHAPPPEFVAAQLDAVLSDIPVRAAKTGMLFFRAHRGAVAGRLADAAFPWWSTGVREPVRGQTARTGRGKRPSRTDHSPGGPGHPESARGRGAFRS